MNLKNIKVIILYYLFIKMKKKLYYVSIVLFSSVGKQYLIIYNSYDHLFESKAYVVRSRDPHSYFI